MGKRTYLFRRRRDWSVELEHRVRRRSTGIKTGNFSTNNFRLGRLTNKKDIRGIHAHSRLKLKQPSFYPFPLDSKTAFKRERMLDLVMELFGRRGSNWTFGPIWNRLGCWVFPIRCYSCVAIKPCSVFTTLYFLRNLRMGPISLSVLSLWAGKAC